MTVLWGPLIVGQLQFYWDVHLRPRLDGLTDDEYLWEPVTDSLAEPVTTLAWRMDHIADGCFTHDIAVKVFPELARDQSSPGTAQEAIAFMEDRYQRWNETISRLDEDAIELPLGEAGGPFAAEPMAGLILHINREVMHHGGEIGLLRDLYRASYRG